jgi:hypothetical protein
LVLDSPAIPGYIGGPFVDFESFRESRYRWSIYSSLSRLVKKMGGKSDERGHGNLPIWIAFPHFFPGRIST